MKITGYRRPDGRFGIRNHVLLIPAMPYALPVARHISSLVRGTTVVTHLNGRGHATFDLEFTRKNLVGLADNPNVGAVLVVGFEPKGAAVLAERIEALGKPVRLVTVVGSGSLQAAAEGARMATELVQMTTAQQREEFDLAQLFIGAECGGSDATSGIISNPATGRAMDRLVEAGGTVTFNEVQELVGAEQGLADRAVNAQVAERIWQITQEAVDEAKAAGVDINEANPAPDNIAGGLTTLEEKAIGSAMKGGSSPVVSVIEYGEPPSQPGLHVMNAPAPAAESTGAMLAAGAQLIVFTTGQGNPAGTPIAPVIKVCANPQTIEQAGDNIDVDVSGVITGDLDEAQATERIWEQIGQVCNGMLTRAEIYGHDEYNIPRIGPVL